jgi:hypothetical protein
MYYGSHEGRLLTGNGNNHVSRMAHDLTGTRQGEIHIPGKTGLWHNSEQYCEVTPQSRNSGASADVH